MLSLAPSLEAFVSDPFDRYVVRPAFLFWQRGKDLNGVRVYGELDEAAVDELFEAFEVDVHPRAEEHRSIVDFRATAYTDLPAMARFVERLKPRMPDFAKKVRRRVIAFPEGALGLAIAGVRFQVPDLYPVRLVSDLEGNLEWLGVHTSDPILEWLEAAVREVSDDVVRSLRVAFARGHGTLEECARATGQSTRSLQRRLGERGSSFREERRRYQLEIVRRDLERGGAELPLEGIAQRAGFRSPRHLATVFRSAFGTTPTAYRAAHRRGP
jgi:AraC-like DNA-binding protein